MRVFFLGAGASKAMADLPTMTEFFDNFSRGDAISYWALNWFIEQNKGLFIDDDNNAKMRFTLNQKMAAVLNDYAKRSSWETRLRAGDRISLAFDNKDDEDKEKKINLEKLFNYLFLCLNPPAGIYAEEPLDFSERRLFVVDEKTLNKGIDSKERADYYRQKIETKSFLLNVQEQLERYMGEKLHSKPGIKLHSEPGADSYINDKAENFVKRLKDEDCIITTNYDLLMDWALKNHKKDMWERSQRLISGEPLSFKERNKGLYLKLHGSLNWFVCPDKECPGHFRIFVKEKLDESYCCERCGRALKRLIVPPIFYKNIQDYPKLGFIWDKAFERLSKAEEVIFYGFSFASSDLPISCLIRETYRKKKREEDPDNYLRGRQRFKINERQGDEGEKSIKTWEELSLPKIVIINPDKNVANNVKEWLGLSNPKGYDKIEEYYDEQSN